LHIFLFIGSVTHGYSLFVNKPQHIPKQTILKFFPSPAAWFQNYSLEAAAIPKPYWTLLVVPSPIDNTWLIHSYTSVKGHAYTVEPTYQPAKR